MNTLHIFIYVAKAENEFAPIFVRAPYNGGYNRDDIALIPSEPKKFDITYSQHQLKYTNNIA